MNGTKKCRDIPLFKFCFHAPRLPITIAYKMVATALSSLYANKIFVVYSIKILLEIELLIFFAGKGNAPYR